MCGLTLWAIVEKLGPSAKSPNPMKVLVVEDDPVVRRILEDLLTRWQYEVEVTTNGEQAMKALQNESPPRLAIIDWQMPGMDGVELCCRARHQLKLSPLYMILLTIRGGKANIVQGLEAGADDYITKPFDQEELKARVQVGARVVHLQMELAERVRELEAALAHVKQLQGLLPICCYCKKIRDDRNYWHEVEAYIAQHSQAKFTHGICPECYQKVVQQI